MGYWVTWATITIWSKKKWSLKTIKRSFNDNGGDGCSGVVGAVDIWEANGDGSAFFCASFTSEAIDSTWTVELKNNNF